MTEVLPQPMSHQSTSSEAQEVLVQTLDHLLERYLQLLHQYQTLQTDLAKQLSSGYFSLTQANYASPTCRRYGQDFYDERMKASTLISVDSSVSAFSTTTASHRSRSSLPQDTQSDRARLPSLKVVDNIAEDDKTSNKAVAPSSDPLKWFGILFPPALRHAQKIFKGAVVDVVPALASVVFEMKTIEEEVTKTRERIQLTRDIGNSKSPPQYL